MKDINIKKVLFVIIAFVFICSGCRTSNDTVISLAGDWNFRMDSTDRGVKEQWWQGISEPMSIVLPGSMVENGYGDDISLTTPWTASIYDSSWYFNPRMEPFRKEGNIKIPFWLSPKKHYVGPAWYQREVDLPDKWKGDRIFLLLERPHIQTRVWANGQEVGEQHSLVAPHEYELTSMLKTGKNQLTIRVDNRLREEVNVGINSHSVSEHIQGNWNGITGEIAIVRKPPVFIQQVQVYPDVQSNMAEIVLTIDNATNGLTPRSFKFKASSFNTDQPVHTLDGELPLQELPRGISEVRYQLPMGDTFYWWDEFSPALYALEVEMETENGTRSEAIQTQFGMREIKIDGQHILVNGKRRFLRGTLNNGEFPLTGYAPTDEESWIREFELVKEYGLNHVRFHSWCPPEAAFKAADRIGVYLQPEGPTWPNHSTILGVGRAIDTLIYNETELIERYYGNYASYVMLAAGNEPRGGNQVEYLTRFIAHWKNKDARRVYTGASVAMSWPIVPANEFMVKSGPRGLDWSKTRPESESDYSDRIEEFPVPYISHELGQWVAFPDFKEIPQYTGVFQAKNFELFQADLERQGMGDLADSFLMSSGRLQVLCYKHEIEKALRTSQLAGFQLLGLRDFPGQGTALVGVLNALGNNKGYITAEEYRRFCNDIVLLGRLPKFVYIDKDTLQADIEIAQYGQSDIAQGVVSWSLTDPQGEAIKKGAFAARTYPTGGLDTIGQIRLALDGLHSPAKYTLQVKLEGTSYHNQWDVWVYPHEIPLPESDIIIADRFDEKVRAALAGGKRVLLNAAGKIEKGKEIEMYQTPVFWNTSWFKMRAPHITGAYIHSEHPLFTGFPTADFTDLQWWELVNRVSVMHLEDFPQDFRPIVQPIDTWFVNRRLGILFEAKVGEGKLMVTSADLWQDKTQAPVARMLLNRILTYMGSNDFNPPQKIDEEMVARLFTEPSKMLWNAYAKDSPDELKAK